MTSRERDERDDTLACLIRLRAYVRYLWNSHRAETGRGPLPYNSVIRNFAGIESDDPWPMPDGTICPARKGRECDGTTCTDRKGQ